MVQRTRESFAKEEAEGLQLFRERCVTAGLFSKLRYRRTTQERDLNSGNSGLDIQLGPSNVGAQFDALS